MVEITKELDLSQQLEQELLWLESVVDVALSLYFENSTEFDKIYELTPPVHTEKTTFTEILEENKFDFLERLVLALALAPHLKPSILDVFLIRNEKLNCDFSEFGGIKSINRVGFQPTVETACFISCVSSIQNRLEFINSFSFDHVLFTNSILERDSTLENSLHQPLQIQSEFLRYLFTGKRELPQFGSSFPAEEITSKLEWSDLILDDLVTDELMEIESWLKHSKLILDDWGLHTSLKPGFRALFYGPPGTGKTLAASLLGKSTGKHVFRIDLSMVVSKYIGETEKNLGRLFDIAQNKDWILFFDEADALFSARTQTRGSNDRHANQEVSYLLQRIEDFPGLIILATNLNSNIDEAFTRRFQTTVRFSRPGVKERRLLWDNYILKYFETEADFPLDEIVEKYEISGGEIINILRFCAIRAAKRNERKLLISDVLLAIKKEYAKINKTI
jgi:AAA+ superfamily predicted ATPase